MKPSVRKGNYDIYPTHVIPDNEIFSDLDSLVEIILLHKIIIIDGYCGVFFGEFSGRIEELLEKRGKTSSWINTNDFLKPAGEIEKLVSTFTGDGDPLFGTRTSLGLADFFDSVRLENISPYPYSDIFFITGPGAALTNLKGLLIYIDLPKNEIQFRSRAGSITNLGAPEPFDPGKMYKRFYFVDWIVLNKHKKNILPSIDIIIDGQNPENLVWMNGEVLRQSLTEMSTSLFRARPWFEPGVWGGSWIKRKIRGLNTDVPNYAWSFELIAPENGLIFESSGKLLEVSFDFLMYNCAESVLGDCYARFGTEFPIRFDFLDTFDGGNLSVQCHPRPDYIKEIFGENFTQEETYYILDTKDKAVVYLGFQEDIDPDKFRSELEESQIRSKPADIEKFVQKHAASKHDLFLIPYGTVHGSGMNNLVLEISSTPYIFTFKMYDWLRLDMNGKPRPINISRAMENLFFDRKGSYVKEKLITKPILIEEKDNYKLYHLPTHETHLYDVHRYHFTGTITIETHNKCHVLSLVEGSSIVAQTQSGLRKRFNYAETFIVPAAAVKYELTNENAMEAMVVLAFVK